MAVYGIVAEYNPFHNGHYYQIRQLKKSPEDAVVVAMSPNVVQRGDFALFDKWTRAQAALQCGADLIVEIPSRCVLSSAEGYARGALSVLAALGFVEFLCFGSECGELDALRKVAALTEDPLANRQLQAQLSAGVPYAGARSAAIGQLCPELSDVLNHPNDILGVEYLRAIRSMHLDLQPVALRRIGTAHHGQTQGDYASAGYLRQHLTSQNLRRYLPPVAAQIFEDACRCGRFSSGLQSLSDALLLQLRITPSQELARLPEMSEGLENRMVRAAATSQDFEQLCRQIKTRRYPMTRICRTLMAALLSLYEPAPAAPLPFVRVLGMTQRGERLLSRSGNTPIIASLKKAQRLGDGACQLAAVEEKCTAAFSLTLRNRAAAQNEFTAPLLRA